MAKINKSKKSISIKDVAKSLNVSNSLVSLVLNNKGEEYGISPITQQKVLDKAKELNYKPNRMAQGLRLGKSKSIGLIVPDISNIFYSKISRCFGDLVDKHGYNLMIYNTDEDSHKEKKIIKSLLEQNIDGIILTSTSMQVSDLTSLSENNIPFILVDRYVDGIDTNFVGVDNYQGTVDSINHLISKGFSKIAFFTVGPSFVSSLEERKKAYLDTLRNNNIEINPDFEITVSYTDIETSVNKKLKTLLEGEGKPDALFIANNKLAIETLKQLKQLNYSIPQDITVACFDNIPLFDVLPYPIMSVSQPILEICSKATNILFDEIISKKEPSDIQRQKVILSTDLIIRN